MFYLNEASELVVIESSIVPSVSFSEVSLKASLCMDFFRSALIRRAQARLICWTIFLLSLMPFVQGASAKDIDDRFMDVVVAVADAHDLVNKESILNIISKYTNLHVAFDGIKYNKDTYIKVRFTTSRDQDGMEISYVSSERKAVHETSLVLCYCGKSGNEKKIIEFMNKRFVDITYRDGINLQINKKYLLWSDGHAELSASISGGMPFSNNTSMIVLNEVQRNKICRNGNGCSE